MSLLIGLQDISLDPVLSDILPSGLGVYQCPFIDVWGSNIAFAGPHPSFQVPQPQEYGALSTVSGTENLSRPEKSGKKKKQFRRRPCLCLSSLGGGGGVNPQNLRHRQQQQHPQHHQQPETLRLCLGTRS